MQLTLFEYDAVAFDNLKDTITDIPLIQDSCELPKTPGYFGAIIDRLAAGDFQRHLGYVAVLNWALPDTD